MKYYFKKFFIFLFVFTGFAFLSNALFAEVLDSWKDAKAYRPKPVLFVHGFGAGNSQEWNTGRSILRKYFSAYQDDLPYLEVIDFNDGNGSIDTYDLGKFNPQGNTAGWTDKLSVIVKELLASDKYGTYTVKLNLICHSMGGLAAREFITNSKYSSSYVDKLIMTGTPNLGSPLAREANLLSQIPKFGWMSLVQVHGVAAPVVRDVLEFHIYMLQMDINGEAVDDMDITETGSGFLKDLNNNKERPQPPDVSYYSIVGIRWGLPNWILFKDWYGGDGVVDKRSQLGDGVISLKDSTEISASHLGETTLAVTETNNKTLKFLDSDAPKLEVTSPNPDITTEIFTYSLNIQGKLFNEYLPADSILKIQVRKEADTSDYGKEGKFFRASDLWIPNNPDSPVAEFNEEITFPAAGDYEVVLAVTNPALNTVVFPETIKVKVSEKPSSRIEINSAVGHLQKQGNTYANALIATPRKNPSLFAWVGQNFCCSTYTLDRAFLLFDTSSLSGKQIVSGKLVVKADYISALGWSKDFSLYAYSADWGPSFGTEDWESKIISLGNTLVTAPASGGSYYTININPMNINAQGSTKLTLINENDLAGIPPIGQEKIMLISAKLQIEYR